MKILFANPPTYENAGSFFRPVRFPTFNYATPVMHPPIYLAYAASYIRAQNHVVSFIDAPVMAMTVDVFLKTVTSLNPDYIIFETSTPSFENDCLVAGEIKQQLPHSKIVFLGTHVTALPNESLQCVAIDAIILGEYEISLSEYIAHGPVGTLGVGYRDAGGTICINEKRPFCSDLSLIPIPARDLIPNYSYFDPILKNPFTFIISGRGCPYPCTFCNWPEHLTGRIVRRRSPKEIVDEIEYLEKNYKFKSFLFNDDTFTCDIKHVEAISQEMILRKVKTPWGCYARADFDNKNCLLLMKKAGCFLLKVGVETADEQIQINVKKNYDLKKVKNAIKLMQNMGFHVHSTFAFGLPGETIETIEKTIKFARSLKSTTVQFSIAVPYPGTEFYAYLKRNNFLLTTKWNDFMPLIPIYQYPQLSYETMRSMLKKAYRTHYFRFKYFAIGLKQLFTQPRIFFGNAKKLLQLVFKNENY
jgi:radical SAM superfamily enzyme YgiQ (UPF0313 family)